jgi:hypothetical protein
METKASLGVTTFLELSPAGPLTGLAKRALPGARLFALKTPDQRDHARRLDRRSRRTRRLRRGRLARRSNGSFTQIKIIIPNGPEVTVATLSHSSRGQTWTEARFQRLRELNALRVN